MWPGVARCGGENGGRVDGYGIEMEKNHGTSLKIQCLMGKSSMDWTFSLARSNNQRVYNIGYEMDDDGQLMDNDG